MGLESAIPFVGGLFSSIANQNAVRQNNLDNMRLSVAMYDKQRSDALADRDFQNFYNSPAAQMARLKAAGLNPNLVYGNGATQQPSAPVRSTDMAKPNMDAPQFDPSAFMGFQDTQLKEQQIDLVKEQIKTQQTQQAVLSTTQALNIMKTKTGNFDLGMKNDLRDISLEVSKQQLRKLIAGNTFTESANFRADLTTGKQLQLMTENIALAKMRTAQTQQETARLFQATQLLKKTNVWQDLENNAARKGYSLRTPAVQRALSNLFESYKNGQIAAPKSKGEFTEDMKSAIEDRLKKSRPKQWQLLYGKK